MMEFNVQGVTVPAVGLGTWALWDRKGMESILSALRLGYRHVDTAQNYGNEEQVGEALRRSGLSREELFITTKVDPSNFPQARFRPSVEESLAKLGVDQVDLLLLHYPQRGANIAGALEGLRAVHEAGLARLVGVSNFSPRLVHQAADMVKLFANQVEYHPYHQQRGLRDLAREMGHLLIAYTPLARGRVKEDSVLRRISQRYGKSPGQVTLRWLVQQGIAPIPKAAGEARQRENLSVDGFALSEAEMADIDRLDQGMQIDGVSHYSHEL